MSVKTPTIEAFKAWAADCAPAARAVLMARVYAQMERERINAYILPIFNSYRFHELPTIHNADPAEVNAPDRLYLCADEIQVAAYFEDCDEAHRAHGFTGPHGHCPALIAENLIITTERALTKLADPLFGIGTDVYGDDRKKYLELLIGACLRAEKDKAAA